MPRSTASATILLANDWLLFITTIPPKPTMESSSPVFPNFRLGMAFVLSPASAALVGGVRIVSASAKPAAAVVPFFRKSRLSIGSLLAPCSPSLPGFFRQKRERGTASGPPSQVLFVFAVAASAGRCQWCAPQKRCSHLTIVFMPGGVITPPVSMLPSYSCARPIATLMYSSHPGGRWRERCSPYRQPCCGRKTGLDSLPPLRKVDLDGSYFFLGGTTASLNAFARRNFTTVLAGILRASPV